MTDLSNDAVVEAARKLVKDLLADCFYGSATECFEHMAQRIAAHTEAALLADRLGRHDETVAAIEAAVKEREAAIMRAYHITLDGLGAPADEWPCNRAAALHDNLTARFAAAAAQAVKERGEAIALLWAALKLYEASDHLVIKQVEKDEEIAQLERNAVHYEEELARLNKEVDNSRRV